MSPMNDYTKHLLAYVPPERIKMLSCGHVIPPENLLAMVVSKGPSGTGFELTFEKRNSEGLIDELGGAILNMCMVVPDGVVVFFPSYAYLAQVIQQWSKASPGKATTLWERLANRKSVFRESKEGTSAEDTLQEYSHAIDAGKGGLLLSVVGGKMSEGINFTDKLGRCVAIVGLPFPNIHSPEWKAKLEHIESTAYRESAAEGSSLSDETRRVQAKAAGRAFYENACMRGVNQSIGRAIRHQNDYASIVLMDQRYGSGRIRGKLPGWIQRGMVDDGAQKSFGQVMTALSAFFRSKNSIG
ncbi:MAG: ATP-dependent DNA helicase chl1 [Thelocarpon impressellum]|nr:MAG: ATP-dependent DNA helicase chl1 [Thelocarpon impressellum]